MSPTSHDLSRRAVLAAGVLAPVAASTWTAPPARAASAYPVFDVVSDFGAVGDNNTDDTHAFQRASWAIARTPEKGAILNIPGGRTYRIGKQIAASEVDAWIAAQSAWVDPADLRADMGTELLSSALALQAWRVALPMFYIPRRVGLEHLEIRGNGAALRLTLGLSYGGFVPTNTTVPGEVPGDPIDELSDDGTPLRNNYGVHVGSMIYVGGASNVTISDLVLSGRSPELRLGGQWGDTGRQGKANGIRLLRNSNVTISDVTTRYHGLDGIIVGHGDRLPSDPPTPHTLVNVVSEYNGRQGLSWTGGRGLTVTNSTFRHTGRAVNQGPGEDQGLPLTSLPGAGVDIEPESNGVCIDGLFTNCRFDDNRGPAMVTTTAYDRIGPIQFDGCRFWGSTTSAIWTGARRIHYDDCDFHGTVSLRANSDVAVGEGQEFTNCRFSDRPPAAYPSGAVDRESYVMVADGQHLKLTGCTVTADLTGSIYSGSALTRTMANCTINHNFDGTTTRSTLCALRGWTISGTTFTEDITRTGSWPILTSGVTVTGTGTSVQGPQVTWDGGATGPIDPGSY